MKPGAMDYDRTKSILLLSGLILIGVVALIALVRGVDRVEVAGTLLFVPVFAGFLFLGWRGGIGLGIAAAAGYLALRLPSIRLVGFGPLAGQIAARTIGYLAFGAGGGWAVHQIQNALERLELRDDIDEDTGLGNSRSFLAIAEVERARADRYQKVFSVVAADFPSPWTEGAPRREKAALRDLGTRLARGVRSSDHVVHGRSGARHVIGLVLPETAAAGARAVADNLKTQLGEYLGSAEVRTVTATYPGREEAMARIMDLFKEIDRSQRGSARQADLR